MTVREATAICKSIKSGHFVESQKEMAIDIILGVNRSVGIMLLNKTELQNLCEWVYRKYQREREKNDRNI